MSAENSARVPDSRYHFDGEDPMRNLPPSLDGFSRVTDPKYVMRRGDLIARDSTPCAWVDGVADWTVAALRNTFTYSDADVWVRQSHAVTAKAVARLSDANRVAELETDPDLPARIAAVVHQDQAESVSWFREVDGRRYLVNVTCHGPVTPEDSR